MPLSRRSFVAGAAAAPLALHALQAQPPERPWRLGVTLAGPEFGVGKEFSNLAPGRLGREYTYNSEATTAYFCKQGLKLLRIPVRWERMQPQLGQALDRAELDRLRTAVAWGAKHGGQVIIDVHNFARYCLGRPAGVRECIIDEKIDGNIPVTRQHFADLWARLAAAFKDEAAVAAYGLMNEPHHLGASDWKAISQAAVDALRPHDPRRLILVPGEDWSSAMRWPGANGPRAWVRDPNDNVAYEAHCYFDRDNSGTYKQTYQDEAKADANLGTRGVERLRPFVAWCRENKVRGYLGEFGCPADPEWLRVLAAFLRELRGAGMPGLWWAAGEWWGEYPLSLQPKQNYRQPAGQLATLLDALAGK